MDAIDKRKKLIADQLKEATDLKMEAEEQLNSYEGKQKALEENKERILNETQNEANEQKQLLLDEARKEYSDLRRRLKESLDKNRDLIGNKLKAKAKEQIMDIVRKVLKDLGDVNLEDQVLRAFLKKINNLTDREVEDLVSKLTGDDKMVVSTEFGLNPEQQKSIIETIKKVFKKDMPLEFVAEESDAMIGIELAVKGHKISWTIGDYLDKLKEETLAVTNEIENRMNH